MARYMEDTEGKDKIKPEPEETRQLQDLSLSLPAAHIRFDGPLSIIHSGSITIKGDPAVQTELDTIKKELADVQSTLATILKWVDRTPVSMSISLKINTQATPK